MAKIWDTRRRSTVATPTFNHTKLHSDGSSLPLPGERFWHQWKALTGWWKERSAFISVSSHLYWHWIILCCLVPSLGNTHFKVCRETAIIFLILTLYSIFQPRQDQTLQSLLSFQWQIFLENIAREDSVYIISKILISNKYRVISLLNKSCVSLQIIKLLVKWQPHKNVQMT